MIPILHLPGEMMPGQFGPISRERRFCRNSQALTMSSVGIPSVMQTMRSSSASAASMMASAANGGGTKITVVSAPVFSTASCTVLKMGQPSCVVPPLPGVTPPTTWVPYAAQALAWKVPSRPVRPCTIKRVFLATRIDINTIPHYSHLSSRAKRETLVLACATSVASGEHQDPALSLGMTGQNSLTPRRGHHSVCRILHSVSHDEIETGIHQDLLAFVHVRTFEAQHHGKLDVSLLRGFYHSCGQRIHAQNTAKDVDQHRFHALIAEQDFKRVRHLLGISAAAYVEEICGHAAGILDDIHRRHRQSGAVNHAADAAVELDVVQAVLRSLDLERIFLRNVAQFTNIGMAEERIVIERQLGVESEQPAVSCGNEWIYFEERCIRVEKRFIKI